MPVITENYTVTYTGNGATTEFAFTFPVIDDGDLVVTLLLTGTSTVFATWVLGTNYTVVTDYPDAGGTVTALVAPSALYDIKITRTVAYTQTLDIINQGGFYPATIQQQLDYLLMMILQLKVRIAALEA